MTFNTFVQNLFQRTGPAYGAGPAGFKQLMKRLGNSQNAYQIIHVAGTNGKGSVCYLLARILQEAGHSTGLFISPHLTGVTERIQINGHSISTCDFTKICETVLAHEEEKLNFFEILTAAAFVYFAEKKVKWVILETGLGGRKDPTNICHPAAAVITSIGLDHCALLGNSLEKIAREKAGIIKKNIPVFCPTFSREIRQPICAESKKKNAPLFWVRTGKPFQLAKINWQKSKMILKKGAARWPLHLMGEKQVQNACLVYQVCRYLKVPEKYIKKGFATVYVPGRFEIIRCGKKTLILDGAHNPQALENLMRFMQDSPWKKNFAVVCGFMADKDYPAMLRILKKASFPLYLTTPGGARAAAGPQLKAAVAQIAPMPFFKQSSDALRAAWKNAPVVLVTGSFYLISLLRKNKLP